MTWLLDRPAPPADPEEAPVSTPRSYGVPWWAGVIGLDPSAPVYDWTTAARHSALACSLQAFGLDGIREGGILSFGKNALSPNLRMRGWLLGGPETPEVKENRRYALRLAVEHGAGLELAGLLQMAQYFADALGTG